MPKLTIKVPTEDQEGKALKTWADYHPIAKDLLFHVPNGGSRNIIEARNLKLQGVRKGVSDYLLPYPTCTCQCSCGGAYGLFIELKRRNKTISKLTLEQFNWLDKMNQLNYVAKVAYGWEEASEIIKEYLK